MLLALRCSWTQMLFLALVFMVQSALGQVNSGHSVARLWNEALLEAIRNDFARPTVHARNLFHTSIAMYDCWATYDQTATTFLLGKTVRGFNVNFDGIAIPEDIEAAREEAISYAAYGLLKYRFGSVGIAPGRDITLPTFDQLMADLGYDISITSDDYSTGSPAALGNYVANVPLSTLDCRTAQTSKMISGTKYMSLPTPP